jgi:hypothetical protein
VTNDIRVANICIDGSPMQLRGRKARRAARKARVYAERFFRRARNRTWGPNRKLRAEWSITTVEEMKLFPCCDQIQNSIADAVLQDITDQIVRGFGVPARFLFGE